MFFILSVHDASMALIYSRIASRAVSVVGVGVVWLLGRSYMPVGHKICQKGIEFARRAFSMNHL